MKLFVDMDGVLADFDAHYEYHLGRRPDREDNEHWTKIQQIADFYLHIPPMADLDVLWGAVKKYHPVILTGVPWSIPDAEENKREWVKKYLGNVGVICCRSRDKSKYASPGDILIDDWERYRHLWVAAGGVWITHTNAAGSINALKELGL